MGSQQCSIPDVIGFSFLSYVGPLSTKFVLVISVLLSVFVVERVARTTVCPLISLLCPFLRFLRTMMELLSNLPGSAVVVYFLSLSFPCALRETVTVLH